MKRTAIQYNRTPIKIHEKKFKRTPIIMYEVVEHMGVKFKVDINPETEMEIQNVIGRRMYVCFGKTNGFPVSKSEIRELLPERVKYLTIYKKTINQEHQTLSTKEEYHALLGNFKIHS